jgi:hypothetical protein
MQVYRDVRSCLVHKYREDVDKRLTYGEAFKQLGGDADLLLEVWGLLDDWGIINFLAPADSAPPPSQAGPAVGAGAGRAYALTPVSRLPDDVSIIALLSGVGLATCMTRVQTLTSLGKAGLRPNLCICYMHVLRSHSVSTCALFKIFPRASPHMASKLTI